MKKAVTLVLLALATLTLAKGELRIFNWSEYIPESVLQDFEKRYDVRIIYDTFEAPEAMMAKLQGGGYREYDLVVPPDYYVPELARSGLIKQLDHGKLPNLKNLYPEFQNPDYDPGIHRVGNLALAVGDAGGAPLIGNRMCVVRVVVGVLELRVEVLEVG